MPTLEYRNKTWTFYDFLQQVKKDAIRAILVANTASLVKEKLFSRASRPLDEMKKNDSKEHLDDVSDTASTIVKKSRVEKLKGLFAKK